MRFDSVFYSMNSLKIRKNLESNHFKKIALGQKKTSVSGGLGNTALYLMKKISSYTKSISTKNDDINFSKRTCSLTGLIKIKLQIQVHTA